VDRGAGAAVQPRRPAPGARRHLAAGGHRRAAARARRVPRAVRAGAGRRGAGRLTHFGGFTGLRKLAGWAAAYDLPLAPHNVCGPVGTAANLHFAVATGNYKVLEHFNDFADPWLLELVEGAPRVDPADGCFGLPAGPGLGVRLDRAAAARRPRTRVHFSLVREGWERRGALPATSPPDG
jgi:L-alanine-DL-glutamate epimerase-like enolase superfamily enzyme